METSTRLEDEGSCTDNDAEAAPLVSVLIPSRNKASWISAAVDSALAQTHPRVEVVVIDDGSTDESRAVLDAWGDRVRVAHQPHRGANAARNHALRLARGAFVQYLDADDWLHPHKIQTQIAWLTRTGADIVYGDVIWAAHQPDGSISFSPTVHRGPFGRLVNAERDPLLSLLRHGSPGSMSYLIRRSILIGSDDWWDPALEYNQVRAFILALVAQGARLEYQPGAYSYYRCNHAITVSSDSARMLEGFLHVSRHAEDLLARQDMLSPPAARALAESYFNRLVRYRHHVRPRHVVSALIALPRLAVKVGIYGRPARRGGRARPGRRSARRDPGP